MKESCKNCGHAAADHVKNAEGDIICTVVFPWGK